MTYAFSPQWKTPINKLDVKRKKETRNYTDLKESNELHHNRWNCMMQYKNLLNLDLRSFDEKPTIDSSTFVAARYNIHIDIIVRASTKINGTLMVIQRLSSFFYWFNPRICITLHNSGYFHMLAKTSQVKTYTQLLWTTKMHQFWRI